MKKKKDTSVRNVSIIGGADGPTSIFIAGRTGKSPLKVRIKNYIYKKRRERAASYICPNPHSLKQVVSFMRREYGAYEMPVESRQYQDMKASLKEGLILENRPELLEGLTKVNKPAEHTQEAVEEMFLQIKQRSEEIARIPDDQFPTDFHVYEIHIDGGRMDIEIDYQWDILGISYSGDQKAMKTLKKMSRRLYLFYGATKEDIQKQTKRYSSLLAALSS